MKNIVVGIDFSENSLSSLRHATAIALKTGGALHLVWVKTASIMKGVEALKKDSLINLAHEELEKLVNESKAEAPNSHIQSVILEGKPYLELTRYAANLKESMIVIGTHGISGFEERIIGSNAFKTVGASTVPVLVLREGIKIKRDIIQVLVPIDTSFETLQKVKPAVVLAKLFAAKIILTGFVLENNAEERHVVSVQVKHAAKLCARVNIRYEDSIVNYKGNMAKAVVKYGSQHEVNLMVIMREGEVDIADIWLGSTTQQLLNTSPMPVLVIPNVNHYLVTK